MHIIRIIQFISYNITFVGELVMLLLMCYLKLKEVCLLLLKSLLEDVVWLVLRECTSG